MRRDRPTLALVLALTLGWSSTASAQSWSGFAAAFPSFPCQDGWMACLVEGDRIDPELQPDAAGRGQPADLRVGWFDLKPTSAFSPFVTLSEYPTTAPVVAAAEPPAATDDAVAEVEITPSPEALADEQRAEEAAAEAAASKAAEADAKRAAKEAEEARRAAEAEAKRQRAEEDAAKKLAIEAARRASAAAAQAEASERERLNREAAAAEQRAADLERQRREADAAAERQRKEEEAAKAKAADEERRRQEAERARLEAEEKARASAEADRLRQEEAARVRAEQEAAARAQAEADAKAKADADAKARAEQQAALAARAAADAAAAAAKLKAEQEAATARLKAEQEAAARAQADAEAKQREAQNAQEAEKARLEAEKARVEAERLAAEQTRLAEEQRRQEAERKKAEEQRLAAEKAAREQAEREAVAVQPVPAPVPVPATPGDCTDTTTLEPMALLGRLTPEQLSCLEGNLQSAPKMTDKKKISLVELMNAWHKGDKVEWERLVRRHLEEIDQSDPELCFRYAIQLSKGGTGNASSVIKWSDVALENRAVWTGETYTSRVYSLYKARAAASQMLWQRAEEDHAKNNSDATRKKADDYRAMTKVYAREWYDYAKSAGKDTQTALQLCIQAAGTAAYCEN